MSAAEMVGYWIAQILGALVGAAVLYLILSGKASGWTGGLGQNGWGSGYLGEYGTVSAFVFEVVGTFLFLVWHPRRPTRPTLAPLGSAAVAPLISSRSPRRYVSPLI